MRQVWQMSRAARVRYLPIHMYERHLSSPPLHQRGSPPIYQGFRVRCSVRFFNRPKAFEWFCLAVASALIAYAVVTVIASLLH